MHSMPIQVLRFEKQTAYDLLWPIAWQTYGIQMEHDWGFYLWFTYKLNWKQQAKPRVKKLTKGGACSVQQHGWFKRKADTNWEANLSFSKLIRNVERLLNLLVFQAEALQNLVVFF